MFLENSAEPGKHGELNPVPVQAVKNVLQTYPNKRRAYHNNEKGYYHS